MHPTLNIAVRAAREAGKIIARYSNRIDSLTITNKARNDFVSEVDRMAEYEIIRQLTRAFPDHGIFAEESGEIKKGEYRWIIDPLDGTTNFLYGIPQYAVSIALQHGDQLEQAVIYDPAKDDLFTASRGEGAQLNGKRLRVTGRSGMENALLATGIPYRPDQDLPLFLKTLEALIPDTAGVRRPGSAALDLAWVAAGRFDGFWEFGLHAWDIAAGVLMVREAGGLVGDLEGGTSYLESGDIVAATPKVYDEMLKRLAPVLRERDQAA